MCNFVIRPIKSYATVDIVEEERDGDTVTIERGDYVEVDFIKENSVHGHKNGVVDVVVPLQTFIHAFTVNPEDIKKVKDEESKWFPKKKDSKESK